MDGVSFRTTEVVKPDASIIKGINQPVTNDRVVDVSNKATFTEDFAGAVKAARESGAKEIFFKGSDNVVHRLPLEANDAAIKLIMSKIESNSSFVLSNNIQFKPAGASALFKGEVKTAEQTLNKSNDKDHEKDNVWKFNNGNATEVNPHTKPDAFKNSIQLGKDDKGNVTVKVIAKGDKDVTASMQGQGFPQTIKEFQKLLVNDFNFNGAIDNFKAPPAKGESTFVQEMKANHPEAVKNLGAENFELLCKNVWSYATTGHDLKGKTDIGDMQGMLRQLNPKILESSDSNTTMAAPEVLHKDKYNALPDKAVKDKDGRTIKDGKDNYLLVGDIYIPRGDDKYGRATMLTTRQFGDAEAANKSEISTVVIKAPDQKYALAINFSDMSTSTNYMRAEQTAQQTEKLEDGNWQKVDQREFGTADRGEYYGMKESAVLAYTKELKKEFNDPNSDLSKLKPGDKALITSFVDTNDSTSLEELNALKKLVADYKAKGIDIDVKFTFGNVEIDLSEIKPEHFIDKYGTSENLKWADIAMPKFREMTPEDLLMSVSLIEIKTSVTPELVKLLEDKLKTLSNSQIEALKQKVYEDKAMSAETKQELVSALENAKDRKRFD